MLIIPCSLIPQRIAHHPGEVLEVVVADENQGGSSSIGVPSHVPSELLVVPSSNSSEAMSLTRLASCLSIREGDDNQALVVRPQDRSPELAVQQLPMSTTSHSQPGSENNMALQEQLHLLQMQMQQVLQQKEEFVERIQQIDQQAQLTQQQLEGILDRMQQTDQQTQHTQKQIGDVLEKIEQTGQQAQRTQQQLEEILGKVHWTDQQAQQTQKQMDEILKKIQQTDQKARYHSIQQQPYERLGQQQQDHLSLQAFDKFIHAQHRVQVVLSKPSSELPVPRLFIILPEPTDNVDGQGRPCSLQFRLYFLCECGAHTMARDYDKPHEVHLANHPGYDIEKQDEFIEKYGSYLLIMMHMVKYGAVAEGLVVPPLLRRNYATEDGEGQERLQSIKDNISRLANDTITYLESAGNTVNSETNVTTRMHLGSPELAQLRSYVNVTEGERSIGGLWATSTQEGHCTWICRNHLLEHYEPAFQQLKYIIFAAGGICRHRNVELKITSETMKKQLYNVIGKVCSIQDVRNQLLLTQVGLDMAGHSSTVESTSEIPRTRSSLESLSLDFGRLSMVANGISHGQVNDVDLTIPRFGGLTLSEFAFIHRCHPVLLKILHASEDMDESRLTDVLQYSTRLKELHVGGVVRRFFIIINSILSTRDKIIQSGQCALRTLEVKREDLIPLKQRGSCSCSHSLGAVTVSFSEEPHSFDMETHVNFDESDLAPEATHDFIRQYGWSIKSLTVSSSFSDRHAELLDQVTQERGSMIERIDIIPDSLTETGLNALDRAIGRSQNFRSVRLCLEMTDKDIPMTKAKLLLERYKGQLTDLCLRGDDTVRLWMRYIERTFQTEDEFPILKSLCALSAWNVPQHSVLGGLICKTHRGQSGHLRLRRSDSYNLWS